MKGTVPIDDLSALGDPYRAALSSMYAGEPQRGANGCLRDIDDTTRIAVAEGMTLFSLCVADRVTSTLEVGLAYGFSTVYLLAALERMGGGTHTAIDPFQIAWRKEVAPRRLVGLGDRSAEDDRRRVSLAFR